MSTGATTPCFGIMSGLPEYGDRVNRNNVSVGDVISYKVRGRWILSKVVGITGVMINVVDLFCELTTYGIYLYENPEINTVTKNQLSPKREIYKVINVKC